MRNNNTIQFNTRKLLQLLVIKTIFNIINIKTPHSNNTTTIKFITIEARRYLTLI